MEDAGNGIPMPTAKLIAQDRQFRADRDGPLLFLDDTEVARCDQTRASLFLQYAEMPPERTKF